MPMWDTINHEQKIIFIKRKVNEDEVGVKLMCPKYVTEHFS